MLRTNLIIDKVAKPFKRYYLKGKEIVEIINEL